MRKALLTLLVLALVGAPSAAASEPEPAFCESTTLHDYLTPLKRMPKLRELPFRRRSEPLFRGVRIGSAGPALAVNGGKAGYQLQWDANPRWDVTLTFARFNGNGKVIQPIGQRHLRLGELAPALITEPSFVMSGNVTPLSFVAPGTTGNHCLTLPIPTSMPTGRYRVSQETVLGWPFQRREQRPFLHAEFEVAAGAAF